MRNPARSRPTRRAPPVSKIMIFKGKIVIFKGKSSLSIEKSSLLIMKKAPPSPASLGTRRAPRKRWASDLLRPRRRRGPPAAPCNHKQSLRTAPGNRVVLVITCVLTAWIAPSLVRCTRCDGTVAWMYPKHIHELLSQSRCSNLPRGTILYWKWWTLHFKWWTFCIQNDEFIPLIRGNPYCCWHRIASASARFELGLTAISETTRSSSAASSLLVNFSCAE